MNRYFYDTNGQIISVVHFNSRALVVDQFPGATGYVDSLENYSFDQYQINTQTQEIQPITK